MVAWLTVLIAIIRSLVLLMDATLTLATFVTHFLSQNPGPCHINLLQREGDLNLGNQVQELSFFMDMVILPNRQN